MSKDNPPSNRQWLRKWLTGKPHQIIGGANDPYMLRWYIIPRNPVVNIYLHKFLRSDDDRALHDHPWWFISLMLKGTYDEVTNEGTTRRKAGSFAFRPAEWRHRVQLLLDMKGVRENLTDALLNPDTHKQLKRYPEKPCWTIIVTGRRTRGWGFWCPNWVHHQYDQGTFRRRDGERFVPWQEFGDAGCGETS